MSLRILMFFVLVALSTSVSANWFEGYGVERVSENVVESTSLIPASIEEWGEGSHQYPLYTQELLVSPYPVMSSYKAPQTAVAPMAPSFAQVVKEQLDEMEAKAQLAKIQRARKLAMEYRADAVVMEAQVK